MSLSMQKDLGMAPGNPGSAPDYLLIACHMTLLRQITQKEIQSWLAFLEQQPTTRGSLRSVFIAPLMLFCDLSSGRTP